MTTQLLATELANLIQESKRKHNDLRQAAEKSLEELRSLKNTSEQGAPEELAQKVNFVNPFIIACGTKNAKFTAIAIVCLQRLIVARALPRSRLNQVLEALMQASSAGLDVQLKILQALPSLVQNYSADLNGDLLITTLNICFTLQSSKNAIVNNTSAATLQQLVVSVFDKVVAEDKDGSDRHIAGVAPTSYGEAELRPAALDAYRIFNDLCLLTENQRPEFIRFTGLSQTFGLELIESVITNHASVFANHPEQVDILRSRAMPLITSALRGKPTFATTVRLVRILYTMLRRHIDLLPNQCGEALEILTQLLDHDSALWKRALCMEVFRGIFAEHALLRRIFALYDAKEGEKDILKTLTATFVRLSTEKPAVIGLGHQSSMPISSSQGNVTSVHDQAMLEASGVTGMINTSGNSEGTNTGISTQWSTIRVPCIDQLDKTEPPAIPESYTYSLILACISSLSDGLAKFILPLTVASEGRNRIRTSKNDGGPDSPALSNQDEEDAPVKERRGRSASFKKNPVPINPLELEDHPMAEEVKVCAKIVDECWPAILATCSTFLYAALDSEYYHGLVRAFQRFAHVAGLLQLTTPRDAFLTTLGKSAVPPNVFTACVSAGAHRPSTPSTPVESGAATLMSNARGLLSSENLTTPTEKQRQPSTDALPTGLSTRNLLCLRALLNLGIALGPTLGSAWRIILQTLQQADFVLSTSSRPPTRTGSFSRGMDSIGEGESASLTANFGNEVRAAETAAARLMESTVDFPNEPFLDVVFAVCKLLERKPSATPDSGSQQQTPTTEKQLQLQTPTGQHRRAPSFSVQLSTSSAQEDQFALTKIGDIASINMERLLMSSTEESGWGLLTGELVSVLNSMANVAPVRTRAADILVRLMLEAANMATSIDEEERGPIQLRILGALSASLEPLQDDDRQVSVADHATDVEIHRIVLDGLKNIIEESGENLISGWEIAFDIIGSVFIVKDSGSEARPRTVADPSLVETRSSRLVRASFSSLQLIASDFLASLPNSCFLILVDTLYKFSSQDDDLNIALTTVTFFWVLSDFLSSGNDESLEITADLMQETEASDLTKKAADRSNKSSVPALWMLLLLRLTAVASDDRLDLRNSAIQTLLRIFDAYGERLSPEAWSICVKSVVFKLLSALEDELRDVQSDKADEADRSDWTGTAVVVLNGISSLLANYLEVLTRHASFNDLWRDLLSHLKTLLDFGILDINTATFKALAHILSQSSSGGASVLTKPTIEPAWDLWSRGVPLPSVSGDKSGDNQACLGAYVEALREVYRLIESDIAVERVQRILSLLQSTVEEASVSNYSTDVEQMTQLQGQVLSAVEMLRTDVDGVPSTVIKQVSQFILLAFEQESSASANPKRTFVALSKASMKIGEGLLLKHVTQKDVYESGALAACLVALNRPISLKYEFGITTRSAQSQPWRLATSTALAILSPTLKQLEALEVSRQTSQRVWSTVVAIADGILDVDCESAPMGPSFSEDEEFDIVSFKALRDLILPALGAENIPEKTRKSYAESLFKTSMIHEPSPSEESIISGTDGGGLSALYGPRAGRTAAAVPTRRARMGYVALDELFSLVSTHEPDSTSALRTRIACTTAPFLILRCALTLRCYIADQPLRGKMPQPLSQRKELLQVLAKLVSLRSESGAIPALGGMESDNRKHLLRLYPLIVKALGVGADGEVHKLLRDALEVVGGEIGF